MIANAKRANASDEYVAVTSIPIADQIARDWLPAAGRRQLFGNLFAPIAQPNRHWRYRNWTDLPAPQSARGRERCIEPAHSRQRAALRLPHAASAFS
jgi:hypothetical protein